MLFFNFTLVPLSTLFVSLARVTKAARGLAVAFIIRGLVERHTNVV